MFVNIFLVTTPVIVIAATGAIVYSPVKTGEAVATFNLDGYTPQSFDTVVTVGKTNYTIQLVAMVTQPTPPTV